MKDNPIYTAIFEGVKDGIVLLDKQSGAIVVERDEAICKSTSHSYVTMLKQKIK